MVVMVEAEVVGRGELGALMVEASPSSVAGMEMELVDLVCAGVFFKVAG